MSFLQSWILLALPLVALPIIIHLMNQRRFQTMPWGAMIFLLAASKMARGFARLRRWLILASRMLVIAGLIFCIARPLASGWLGLAAGNRTDTTIILLDRSPSMTATEPGQVVTKLASGREQLAESLGKLKSDHWVLIDSATGRPQELNGPEDLLTATRAEATGASADLPGLLQTTEEYVRNNQTGRTDIWICSDLRQGDWDAESGRWSAVRDGFAEWSDSVRFYLLAFPDLPRNNRAIRVVDSRRHLTETRTELLVSLEIRRSNGAPDESIPIEFNIDGARSVLNVDLSGPVFELQDHPIPLDSGLVRGWGTVSLPADSVPLDNTFYFVFDEPPVLRSLLVTDEPEGVRPLELMAEIPSVSVDQNSVDVIRPTQLAAVDWDEVGLLIWKAPLPRQADALTLQSFVDDAGQIIFLPPRNPSGASCFGIQWKGWKAVAEDDLITQWRGDSGLLAHTHNGMALPLGELRVRNCCELIEDPDQPLVPLASMASGMPLLVQSPTDRGGVYALATDATPENSTLAANGVVLYVMVQRALQSGAVRLANVHQGMAGRMDEDASSWKPVVTSDNALSSAYALYCGVFRDGERMIALNRSVAEDDEQVLSGDQADQLFGDLPFVRVQRTAGSTSSLIREVWRLFLLLMIFAMVAEAVLCMPNRPVESPSLRMEGSGA